MARILFFEFEEIKKIFQIDIKGGVGNYKPILKVSTLVQQIEEDLKNEKEYNTSNEYSENFNVE